VDILRSWVASKPSKRAWIPSSAVRLGLEAPQISLNPS